MAFAQTVAETAFGINFDLWTDKQMTFRVPKAGYQIQYDPVTRLEIDDPDRFVAVIGLRMKTEAVRDEGFTNQRDLTFRFNRKLYPAIQTGPNTPFHYGEGDDEKMLVAREWNEDSSATIVTVLLRGDV